MQVDRTAFLSLTLALAACHQSALVSDQRAKAARASTVAIGPPPPPAPTVVPNDPCSRLAAENDAILKHPSGTCVELGENGDEPLEGAADVAANEPQKRAELSDEAKNPLVHACHVGKDGTWAFVLVDASLETSSTEYGLVCGWTVTYKWTYTTDPSVPLRSGEASAPGAYLNIETTSGPDTERVFDYDNDGRDELIVSSKGGYDEDDTGVEILTVDARTHAIGKYNVGASYNGVVDADHDGRPDLLWNEYFAAESCGLAPAPVTGPTLLLHSLPDGKFSQTDDVARRWAATECPAAKRKRTFSPDDDCAFTAACMRIWGRSSKDVRAAMTPTCASQCNGGDLVNAASTWKPPFATLEKHTPMPFPPAPSQPSPRPEASPPSP